MKDTSNFLYKSRVLIPVIIVTLIIISALFFFIPYITEKNTIDSVVRNSKNMVEQIKLTREYYTNTVVRDIKEHAPKIEFDYNHWGVNGKIPLPTTTIHDLSKIFSENSGLKFNLYSKYPFKNREDRVLTDSQKEALAFTQENPDGLFIKRDTVEGKEVLRVAVTDYMTTQACVDCHNSHPEKTWQQGHWKLGDKRGVLEVITPLEKELAANKLTRNYILGFISTVMLLLMGYYIYAFIQRQRELLDENDILEQKINKEVQKNLKQERQLVQQSRTSAMGEMMAAIIHQWKQPLNSISIANSAIDLQLELDDMDKEHFAKQTAVINTQIEHMSNTMNDFRNFFRPSSKQVYEVQNCVNEVIKLIGKVLAIQKVTIKTELENGLKTQGYPNELNQVIINLLNNARDIIKEKNPPIKDIFIRAYHEGDYIVITVTDLAGGIPEEIIDKIFDAYFTTKPDDKGTGIGLDMSKTIIEKVDGVISVSNIEKTVDSHTYKGACFQVMLPRAAD